MNFFYDDKLHYEKLGDGTIKNIEEEIPFDIPNTWSWCRLKDVGEIIAGGTPDTKNLEYWNGNINWLTPADLSGYENKYISCGNRTITKQGLTHSSAQLLSPYSVLFSSRAPIGYCVINTEYISTNQGFKSIDNYNKLMTEYIYYYLLFFTPYIKSKASGTTFKEISGSAFSQVLFVLPPLAEQKRIVSKIEELFARIDRIEEDKQSLLKLIDKAKDKVLDLAMTGKLVKPDPNDEPASKLLEKIFEEKKKLAKEGKIKLSKDELLTPPTSVDNDYYKDLPKNWEIIELGKICEIARGGSPRPIDKYITSSNNESYNWIKIGDTEVGVKYITSAKQKIIKEGLSHTRYVEIGDFLLSNSMSFGRPYILKINGCIHDGWLVIHDIYRVLNQNFLYYLLSSKLMYNQMSNIAKGSTVKNLKSDTVKLLRIPVPPFDLQKRIADYVENFLNDLDKIKDSL